MTETLGDRGIFRGRTKDGEWLEGYLLISGGFAQIWVQEKYRGCNNYVVDPDTVSEYTGLKDKNGKRIYEGDIVEYAGKLHDVVYENRNGTAYFGIKISNIETWPFGNSVPAHMMEIKGNLHNRNGEIVTEFTAFSEEGRTEGWRNRN